MTITTREFLKEHGLKFKASYAGIHADTSVSWNIRLDTGAQSMNFNYVAAVDSDAPKTRGSRIEPPTPESAMKSLAERLRPALLDIEGWGDLHAEQTAPFKFGVPNTSKELESAPPQTIALLSKISKEYVESASIYNHLGGMIGEPALKQLASEVDFTELACKRELDKRHAPSFG